MYTRKNKCKICFILIIYSFHAYFIPAHRLGYFFLLVSQQNSYKQLAFSLMNTLVLFEEGMSVVDPLIPRRSQHVECMPATTRKKRIVENPLKFAGPSAVITV
jgi:hypothetical protein